MVSYNSHTNIIDDELLILVIRVTNISFMEATLVTTNRMIFSTFNISINLLE